MRNQLGYDCVIQTLRTANVLWRESRRFFRPFEITEAQFNVLPLLGQQTRGMSQRELSDRLVVDRSNVTLLLDRMEKRGWIVRRDVPGDRRVYRVVLTRAGEILWRKIFPHYQKAAGSVVSNFTRNELRSARSFLTRLEQQTKHWEKTRSLQRG